MISSVMILVGTILSLVYNKQINGDEVLEAIDYIIHKVLYTNYDYELLMK